MRFLVTFPCLALATALALSSCTPPAPPPAPAETPVLPATATLALESVPLPSVVAAPPQAVGAYRSKGAYDLRIERDEGKPIEQQLTFDANWKRTDNPRGFDMEIRMTGMELMDAVAGAPDAMAVLLIGDNVYANFGDAQWFTSSRDQAPLEQLPYFFANPEDLVPPLGELERVGLDTINGVETVHLAVPGTGVLDRFFVNEEPSARGKLENGRGDVWIAADGGYLVKLVFQADVTDRPVKDASGADVASDQTLTWTYERYDFNSDFAINPPSGTGQPAVAMPLPGIEGAALTLPPASELKPAVGPTITALAQVAPAEVSTSLESQLAEMGWQPQGGDPPVWSKDGLTLTLVVAGPVKGPARISLTVQPNANQP